jgi:peptidoglycan/LPS O-acetylase OafA/YrhL
MTNSPPIDSPARYLPEPCHELDSVGIRSEEQIVLPRHIASLDGLRAIAILVVIFHHCGQFFLLRHPTQASFLGEVIGVGGQGVDLFFALSGFLITGILLDTRERKDYFPRFYWRRALRIWPLYYCFLFAALLVHARTFRSIGFAPYALYYRNFLGPDRVSDYTVGHFWSLCVEEQFYLVWPLVIYFCAKRFRIALVVLLTVTAFVCRSYSLHRGMDVYIVERLPFCRMDSLLGGAAIAIGLREWSTNFVRRVSWIGIVFGFIGVAVCGPIGTWQNDHYFPRIGFTACALLFAGLVGICATGLSKLPARILASSFLRAISTRSYAMYVFHLIPLWGTVLLLQHRNQTPTRTVWLGLIVVITLVTYGLAWLSWRFLEQPVLRLKDYRLR